MNPDLHAWSNRVEDAARRLAGIAHRTPVFTSRTMNALLGSEIFFKAENLQRAGAFKFRGAYNAVSRLTAEERGRGVITFSSGNHAQAVALVSRILGVAATVVMPDDAPRIKRRATEGYGARVILYDPRERSREEIAREIQAREGSVLIPPFDHPDVIAGQGTAALELWEQTGGLDRLLVPCGGGGLLSGCAVAIRSRSASCAVIGIEPALADDATRSFRTGVLHTVHHPPTIADGTRTPSLGRHTFPLVRAFVADMATVREESIARAVRLLCERLKLVVEPSGALGLAALLEGAVMPGGRVGVLLSGGNIDGAVLRQILEDEGEAAPAQA